MAHVILFVDDEAEVLGLLRKTSPTRTRYVTLTASSAEEALAILEKFEVDLLVTDQRMPGMTGIELVARARQRWPDLTAILLTAYTDPKEIVDAINRGQVYRYLTKPWDNADLRQTVIRALEQVQLKRDRARLHAELERRFAALLAATDVARDVGVAESPLALVERLVERLPRIVPCDVVAALLVPETIEGSFVREELPHRLRRRNRPEGHRRGDRAARGATQQASRMRRGRPRRPRPVAELAPVSA